MSTLAIIGAGPGIGLAVAREFGRHGYHIALIARNRERLDDLVARLADEGIIAAAFPADISIPAQLISALVSIEQRFGTIDLIEFSPNPPFSAIEQTPNVTVEGLQRIMEVEVYSTIAAINHVLPGMIERGNGAILVTLGGSAQIPVPFMGNMGIAMSGLRNYLQNLHVTLKPNGIYVGSVCIHAFVKDDGPVSAARVASTYAEMVQNPDRFETDLKDPALDLSALGAILS
jgi:short-subunit dehydrogenase